MGIDESLVQEIGRYVQSVTRLDRITIFGSTAMDKISPCIDIFIAKRDSGDRHEESRNVMGSIAYPVNKYVKMVHRSIALLRRTLEKPPRRVYNQCSFALLRGSNYV